MKTGHFTFLIFDKLSNLSLTNIWASDPRGRFLMTWRIDVNGEIRIRAHSLKVEAIWTAGPDPIDLPNKTGRTDHDNVLLLEAQLVDREVQD
jgi:hypothetical protein